MRIKLSLVLLLLSTCICSAKAVGEGYADVDGGGGRGEVLAEELFLENYLRKKAGDSSVKTENEESSDTSQTNDKQVESGPVAQALSAGNPNRDPKDSPGITQNQLMLLVGGCAGVALIGIIAAAVCWYKIKQNAKDASDVDYPAYGVTGPAKDRLGSPGDRKLAQSVQMYHYQHQKQQMIALEKANGEMKHDASDDDSEEENEEGDYTVYECPGLAPTGEMEVKNPLFSEDSPPSEKRPDQGSPQH